jgi:hypothetical protein
MQEEKREFQGLLGKEWAQKWVKSYCLEWVYSYLWDGMREWSESGQGYVEYDRSEHSYHLK